MASKIVTPVCRLSFPNLFVPKAPEPGKEPVYGASFLFTLDTDITELEKAARAAAKEKWGDRAKEMFERKQIRWPIKDQADKQHLSGYTEGAYISTSSKTRPGVVDASLKPIMDPAEVFAGQLVRASLNAYAWEHPTGGKGVSFGLQNVMIVKDDGTRFDGRSKPENDFAEFAATGTDGAGAGSKSDLWD